MEGEGGVTIVAMVNGLEHSVDWRLTLRAQAPPPLPRPSSRSFEAWRGHLPCPLFPVCPLTLTPAPLIGPAETLPDCFSQ